MKLRLIDAHTHIYPQKVYEDPMGWAIKHGECHWKNLVAPRANGDSLQGFVDRKTMLQDMDLLGIEKSILLGWYWENPSTCLAHNEWMRDWVKGNESRFVRALAIHPQMEDLLDEMKRAYDEGVKGIGECFPYIQASSPLHKDWDIIYKQAILYDWPITFHVTEPVGRQHSGVIPHSLSDYVAVATRYPDLKIILAHWGGLLPFYELNPFVKKKLKNVYYDTAASMLLYDKRIWSLVTQAVGVEKILFGSDYPLKSNPHSTELMIFNLLAEAEQQLEALEIKKILHDNAKRIWGI